MENFIYLLYTFSNLETIFKNVGGGEEGQKAQSIKQQICNQIRGCFL